MALSRLPGLSDRVEYRPDPREPLVKKIRAGLAAGDIDRAHRLARDGVQRRLHHVQVRDLHAAILHHRGESAEALQWCMDSAAQRVRWLRERQVSPDPPPSLAPHQRIFISGYFKSGSSAVMGYLSDVAGVTRWTPGGEWRLVKSPGGLADLARRFDSAGGLAAPDLVDFYLHLTGWRVVIKPANTYDKWAVVNRNSAAMFTNRRAFGYVATCLEGFLELTKLATSASFSADDLAGQFREVAGRALDAAAAGYGGDVVVADQPVNAWRLPISRFLPASTFVIVHRDPRDQFADVRPVREQPGRKPTNADAFTRTYRRNRDRVDRDVPVIARDYGHRSVRLSFEDFVLDHERTAGRLLDTLGLVDRGRAGKGFSPRWARDGIGRYRRRLSQEEATTLTGALPEFLDKRVEAGT